jgi:hypothetical protein
MAISRKGEDGRSISLVILKVGGDLILERCEAIPSDKRCLLGKASDAKPILKKNLRRCQNANEELRAATL